MQHHLYLWTALRHRWLLCAALLTGVQQALSLPADMHCDPPQLASARCAATPLADKQREAALLAGVQHALTFPAAVQCKAAKLSAVHGKVALLTDPTPLR